MDDSWICHAKPAKLGGKTCGATNTLNGLTHRGLVCCASCGATKGASDARLAKLGSLGVKLGILGLLLLGACATVDSAADTVDINTCCVTSRDPYTCAMDKLDPGQAWDLVCGIYVDFPAVTRWDLAVELAELACANSADTYCVPVVTREYCAHKLDPWCAAFVDDGNGLESCRENSFPGAVAASCAELF